MKVKVLAGILMAGICVVAIARPVGRSKAQESSSSQQQQPSAVIGMEMIPSEPDINLLRQDIRAKKQQLIGENLQLTDSEAEKFWPIYNHYTRDLKEVYDEKFALIKEYGETWGTMSNDQALIYIRRWLEVDQKVQALRLQYVPVVSQVLPGKKAATFFQLDRRVNMMIDFQLSSQIPLVQGKKN